MSTPLECFACGVLQQDAPVSKSALSSLFQVASDFVSGSSSSSAAGAGAGAEAGAQSEASVKSPLCLTAHIGTLYACRTCTLESIAATITSGFPGMCPAITCSCEHEPEQEGEKKRQFILDYAAWSKEVPAEVKAKYDTLAGSVLAFLCGGCHTQTSTMVVATDKSKVKAAATELQAMLGEGAYAAMLIDLGHFEQGKLTSDEVYARILNTHVMTLSTDQDRDAYTKIQKILMLVENPERRNNLHLRHLRARPRFWTACCNREHCFRCKTKDFHTGKSCEEMTSSLDNTIIPCITCGASIVRGDGCDSLVCVCGRQFRWSDEKRSVQRSEAFSQAFPTDTANACAELLCFPNGNSSGAGAGAGGGGGGGGGGGSGSSSDENRRAEASAWKSRHAIEVNFALLNIWKNLHTPRDAHFYAGAMLPSQAVAAANTNSEAMSGGLQEAAGLWKTANSKQVAIFSKSISTSRRSLFDTMVPNDRDKPREALRLLGTIGPRYRIRSVDSASASARKSSSASAGGGRVAKVIAALEKRSSEKAAAAAAAAAEGRGGGGGGGKAEAKASSSSSPSLMLAPQGEAEHKLLIASARLWLQEGENKKLCDVEHEAYEKRSAQNYLRLYGSKAIVLTRPAPDSFESAYAFDSKTSNTSLTFTDEYKTVTRAGSVSCYPAAFVPIPSERSSFAVEIVAAPREANWLTFGICKVGGMRAESSDGVGRTTDTWGFCDDRNRSCNDLAHFSASGRDVGSCRKLNEGDRLRAKVDLLEGWLEVSLNEEEAMHRFTFEATSDINKYAFAMTFANEHTVTIIDANEGGGFGFSAAAAAGSALETTSSATAANELNPDHSEMFACFKRSLRKVEKLSMSGKGNGADSAELLALINERAAIWQGQCCDGTFFFPTDSSPYNQTWRTINRLGLKALNKAMIQGKSISQTLEAMELEASKKGGGEAEGQGEAAAAGVRAGAAGGGTVSGRAGMSYANVVTLQDSVLKQTTWQNLYDAACWMKQQQETIDRERRQEMALKFWQDNSEDAAFMACLVASQKDADKHARKAALAFMELFPDDVAAWYAYNDECSDQLIVTDKRCRCIPRHHKNCPTPAPKRREEEAPPPPPPSAEELAREEEELNRALAESAGGAPGSAPPEPADDVAPLDAFIEIEGLEGRSAVRTLQRQMS